MDFLQLVHQRESTRKYSDKPVEAEKIEHIMQACRLAPSACNSQPWKFVIVTDAHLSKEVARATFSGLLQFNRFALQAPVMVAIVSEPPKTIAKWGGQVKDKDFSLIDLGIVAEHFCLQAVELGLGTCMIGWFDEPKIQILLEIPQNRRVFLVISLGYPASSKRRIKIRKPMEKIVSFNKY